MHQKCISGYFSFQEQNLSAKEVGELGDEVDCVYCIGSSHQQGYRYEQKVVLLHLWCVNVKTIPGFIHIPLADFL
jgi:hypothetical protein